VPPKIIFGVNMNFAKYVYGRKRAVEVVRRQLGLRHVQMVTDNDFGAVFYAKAPEAFRDYHYQIHDHAASQGVSIPSVFTVYRDAGGIANRHPEIRDSAYLVGLSLIEQAACYRARSAGLSLFTMNREDAEDPERYQSLFFNAMEIWKRWMADARRLGVRDLVVEMAAAYREGCSTIDDTRATLELLDEHHEKNPDTTVPVRFCYDTGHGISPTESRDDRDREFQAWLEAFPSCTTEIHLKNTDEEFLSTMHFDGEGGIIEPKAFLQAVRDTLTVPEVHVFLEVPGKRGREIGERRTIEEHVKSIEAVRGALEELGYRENEGDWSWEIANS
jgi:hypothetical protein